MSEQGYYVRKDKKGRIVSASTMPQGAPIYQEIVFPVDLEKVDKDGNIIAYKENVPRMEMTGYEPVEGEEFIKGEMPADLEIFTPMAPDMIAMERNRLLAESDWVVTRASEQGEEVPQDWKDYRAALRAIDETKDPDKIKWPVKPE